MGIRNNENTCSFNNLIHPRPSDYDNNLFISTPHHNVYHNTISSNTIKSIGNES